MPNTEPTKNLVCEFHYDCTQRGLDEDGVIVGFWTGEIDEWGKYTIQPIHKADRHYLFLDEIIAIEEHES